MMINDSIKELHKILDKINQLIFDLENLRDDFESIIKIKYSNHTKYELEDAYKDLEDNIKSLDFDKELFQWIFQNQRWLKKAEPK